MLSITTRFALAVAVASFGLASVAVAQGADLEARKIDPIANPNVRFSTVGPYGSGPLLRLSLLLSEVYYSVAVEELYEDPLKEGAPSVEAAYLLPGRSIAVLLEESKLTQLQFVRWRSPVEVELTNGDLRFLLRRTGPGQFEVRRLDR